ncbi:MAG: BACON domain-containing protein, partial [Alistipes sp.]|nr:BACON domain-containing protein [Alistipes sp.]
MKNILCAFMSLLLFVACTSEETPSSIQAGGNESVTPSITLDQNYLNFDEHSDVQTISFHSTMDWTAELINDRADGWCSISATSGTAGSRDIDVNVTENTSTDDRTASVIIKSGAISKTVRISQKQRDALTVTTSTFEVESTKGKIYIEVKANIDFEYTINGSAAEWITPIQTRALKTTKLGFNIAENKTMQRREGTITIHSGEFSETVTVYQKDGGDAILLSQKEYVVSNEGEEISIDVTSSVDVELEMPDVDWITRNTSRAVSTNTYYFTIAENPTNYQRESYITFKNAEKKLSERVKIVQVQHDAIIIGKAHYEVDKNGEELKIDIQTNADVNISISDNATNWITHIQSRALPTKSIYFEILPYHDYGSRTATITFSSETTSQSVSITQSGIELGTPNNNEIYYTTSNKMTITPDLS